MSVTLLACACANVPTVDSSVDCGNGSQLQRPSSLQIAFTLGQRVVQVVEAEDAQVALIARVGTDLRRFGVQYSHAGWLWRTTPKAKWRIVHQLNACGTSDTRLYETGPATFFMDQLSAPQAAVLLPSAALQQRLHEVLASSLPENLLGRRYNFFAHPESASDQNSAAWAAELLAVALAQPGTVLDRAQAQAVLRRFGHLPSHGALPWYEKLGSVLFYRKVIRLADQPDGYDYQVTSVDSLIQLLSGADPQTRNITIDLQPPRS